MSACRVKPLLQGNLAPSEALRHPDYFEWRDVETVSGEPLDTSGCQNLRLECINCGWTVQGAVPPIVNEITVCPDCGENLFLVTRLFERCTESVPEFAIRRTKAGYIHIDGWQHLKDATVYFTCNGQDPSVVDSRFTRPFKPDFDDDAEIRAVCYWGEFKSQVASMLIQDQRPAASYQCRFCGSLVEGRGERITCSTCGVSLITNGIGPSSEEPPGFRCSSCRTGRLNIGTDARLRCESCGAEYIFSNTWNFSCWRIKCPVCRKNVALMASESAGGNNFCPECHYPLCYDTEHGWQAAPLQIPPSINQPEPSAASLLAAGKTKTTPTPESPQSPKANNNWGCWGLICLFIFICLKACDS